MVRNYHPDGMRSPTHDVSDPQGTRDCQSRNIPGRNDAVLGPMVVKGQVFVSVDSGDVCDVEIENDFLMGR